MAPILAYFNGGCQVTYYSSGVRYHVSKSGCVGGRDTRALCAPAGK